MNNNCFNNKEEESIDQLIDRVRLLSYGWLKAKNPCLSFDFGLRPNELFL